jgi:hypothetical protein
MKTETKKRLWAMSTTEREKRLDELNRELEATQQVKYRIVSRRNRGTGVAEKEVRLHAALTAVRLKVEQNQLIADFE